MGAKLLPLTALVGLALQTNAQIPSAIGGTGVDLDGDGMSDIWEAYYGARNLAPNLDTDGDGSTNLEESGAGTNPFDANSHFFLAPPTIDRSLQELQFTLPHTQNGKSYQFKGTTDLGTWLNISNPVAGNNATQLIGLQPGATLPQKYFTRIEVQDPDTDLDGLLAYEEQLLGYSDTARHSNGSNRGSDYARAVELFTNGSSFTLGTQIVSGQLPTLEEAARFLIQAGMGADYELIQQVAQTGFSAWIESEFSKTPNYHAPRVISLAQRIINEGGEQLTISNFLYSWWDINMRGSDMLRQRVAFALSQILVISMVGSDLLEDNPWGLADYYDVLVKNAFGNYRDILYDVTYHPVMGLYLSHVKNRKGDPTTNRFPDENYAREVMQLFSIGLYELNQDGTRKQDSNGNDIPTYSNADIREFAKIFTGLTYDGSHVSGIPDGLDPGDNAEILNEFEFLDAGPFFNNPMQAYEPAHDNGPKQLLNYTTVNGDIVTGVIPAGQTTDADINAAIDNIFNHPNVGPFLANLLIQRMVKSNPSPAYINRVALAFNDNGQGVRGDMKSVIRAILLDPEARNRGYLNDPTNGRLREPYMRYLHLCRAFNLTTGTGNYRNDAYNANMAFQQQPLAAPSVFNFYLPNHSPLGPINDAGLVAPEFAITTASTVVATMNFWVQGAFYLYPMELDEVETEMDLETEYDLMESNPVALVDRLDTILTYGSMNAASKSAILNAISQAESAGIEIYDQVHLAIYLFVNSPDFAVLR
ncbi:MAG: DUF1800 family protein [Verrucomicrobiota bacterium]